MGVSKYKSKGRTYWSIDEYVNVPDGRLVRIQKRSIPTQEQAVTLAAKLKIDAFEGRYFDRPKAPSLTVREAWDWYMPIAEMENDSWKTDRSRAHHLIRHLGARPAMSLTEDDVVTYRTKRLAETTRRGGPPSPALLDREVELLKRMLNRLVRAKKLPHNPVACARLLREPNVRTVVIAEEVFVRLIAAAEPLFRAVMLVAYDTGMRLDEVLDLKVEHVDLKDAGEAAIRLPPQDTKTEKARVMYLTDRARDAIRDVPRAKNARYVFPNPKTEKPYQDIRKMFSRACKAAGLEAGKDGLWFHDLRRSFVTKARRAGIPESVVMKMSGHKTRAVFDRYNIIEEQDLREARDVIQRSTPSASVEQQKCLPDGEEMVKVDSSDASNTKAPPESSDGA